MAARGAVSAQRGTLARQFDYTLYEQQPGEMHLLLRTPRGPYLFSIDVLVALRGPPASVRGGHMKVDVTTEIDIDRPRADVAAFAADPDNATTWYQNIKAVRWETPKPVRVGSRMAFEARFLGRSLAYTYEVRELEPGSRLVMSTDQGPFPMETTYTWHDIPTGGTHMTLRNRGEPSGFANFAAPLISAQMRRSTDRDLKLLKSLMETRPSA